MKVAIVLPAYNEAGNITPLVTELMSVAAASQIDLDVVVVDDGSTDGTRDELAILREQVSALRVLGHSSNLGFSRALKTGLRVACGDGYDAVVSMDCDLSHRAADMPKLIAKIVSGADVVLGSRFMPGGGMVGVPTWRVAISRAGNALGRVVLRLPVTDFTTGYRAYRRHVLERLSLEEESFAIQLEAVVKACVAGFAVAEVPVTLGTRRHGKSHMYYSARLFMRYYRLLMKCRSWVREGRLARVGQL